MGDSAPGKGLLPAPVLFVCLTERRQRMSLRGIALTVTKGEKKDEEKMEGEEEAVRRGEQ